jgi:positive regulator of sigma E activity
MLKYKSRKRKKKKLLKQNTDYVFKSPIDVIVTFIIVIIIGFIFLDEYLKKKGFSVIFLTMLLIIVIILGLI